MIFSPRAVTDAETLPIGDLAEELWVYSKFVELLTDAEDTTYLVTETQNIHANITSILCTLKDKLESKDFEWLNNICNDVFSGKRFDDALFNDVIEYFMQKKMEK